ncbi:MORN repeat-containing protein 3-like [Harmonia axyridis]|uniref:MORN repeat-containing protein 3-like n=1 Tax=Harmonia axyridis TaxID=115357 RepID=UPI001E277656|nr:MORN repeat-containing protein 3-like [Harmonia axyridis]
MPFLKDRSKVKQSRSERLDLETSRQGLRHKIFNTLGDMYVGEWDYNKKQGKGALLARFGKLYEGDFYKGRREGFGVLSSFVPATNTFTLEYRGDWKGGHMHGKGLRIFPDGSFYLGNFKWDKRSGYGQLWNKDCSFYDGDWLLDKYHGEGMFIFQNGNRYEGEWENGLKHGKGRYFHLDSGQLQEGVWFEDMCVFSTIVDIPYRQCSISPSKYPVSQIQLQDPDNICQQQELLALEGIGNVCDYVAEESFLKIKSSEKLLI